MIKCSLNWKTELWIMVVHMLKYAKTTSWFGARLGMSQKSGHILENQQPRLGGEEARSII